MKPRQNESGQTILSPRASGLKEQVYKSLKPCSADLNAAPPKFFAHPVDQAGNLQKIQLTPPLYKEMSGGSKLVPGGKDYTGMPRAVLRFLIKDRVAQHCDVVNFLEVKHRLGVEELKDVREFTVIEFPATDLHPGTRWVAKMPLYMTEDSNSIPFLDRHGVMLLRELDKVTLLTPGERYGNFEYNGVGDSGMQFSWIGEASLGGA